MAISINDVYTTTLTLLNKEQRGYVTPTEFNEIAGVVQNEVFEGYFQKAGIPENMDSELADIGTQFREKLQPFITHGEFIHTQGSRFYPIEVDDFYRSLEFYTVYPNSTSVVPLKADRMSSSEARMTSLSPLTSPTIYNPVVVFETEVPGIVNVDQTYPAYSIYPDNSTEADPLLVEVHYIRTPKAPNWIGTTIDGQVVANPNDVAYQDFELHVSDYAEVVAKVLGYFGLQTRSDEVLAAAGGKEQQNSAI